MPVPRVSVIIPAYNAAKFVRDAIDSVLRQTAQEVEIIVVDDGSTDGTSDVVTSYADPRVRYFWQPHAGRSVARNRGIENSVGEFVAFLDADDWWSPSKLGEQLALFKENDKLGLVYCWLQQVDTQGRLLRTVTAGSASQAGGAWRFDDLLLAHSVSGPGSTVIVPRSLLRVVGGFDPDINYGEDWEFCLRVASRSQVGFVPTALAHVRCYGAYMPRKMHDLCMQAAAMRIVEAVLRYAGLPDDCDLAKRAYAQALCHGALTDAGIRNSADCRSRLEAAMCLNPGLFLGEPSEFSRFAVAFSRQLYDTVTPFDESLSYLDRLFDYLTYHHPEFKRLRRQTLALLWTIRAYEASREGLSGAVRLACLQAAAHDARRVRDRGLLSAFARSFTADAREN